MWPTPVFLPGEFYTQRKFAGYNPWGCKESDTTGWLSLHFTRFVIVFLPRSKHLLISCLWSLYTVILELPPPKNCHCFHVFSYSPWSDQTRAMNLVCFVFFLCWILSQLFHSTLSSSSRGSLGPFHFLPLEWYHLPIWDCWYFSQLSWFQLVIHPPQLFAWCTLHSS